MKSVFVVENRSGMIAACITEAVGLREAQKYADRNYPSTHWTKVRRDDAVGPYIHCFPVHRLSGSPDAIRVKEFAILE